MKSADGSSNPVASSRSVLDVLASDQLAVLRDAFERAGGNEMFGQAMCATGRRWQPNAAALVDAILSTHYADARHSHLDDRERELVLIALLASTDQTLTLAIHLYYGLMVGLSVEKVADALMLMGTYAGVNHQAVGLRLLQRILTLLKDITETNASVIVEGRTLPAAHPHAVLVRLLERFEH